MLSDRPDTRTHTHTQELLLLQLSTKCRADGRRQEKQGGIKINNKRLHHNLGEDSEDARETSASPHALGGAPATLSGSICRSPQLQVIEGASLQEDTEKKRKGSDVLNDSIC